MNAQQVLRVPVREAYHHLSTSHPTADAAAGTRDLRAAAILRQPEVDKATRRSRELVAAQVLSDPEIESAFRAVNGRDLREEPFGDAVKEVLGPTALMRNTSKIPPFMFASASIVAARGLSPHVQNAVNALFDLPAKAQPASAADLAVALALALGGALVAGSVSSYYPPVERPITVRWPYASPTRRFQDYLRAIAVNGPVVGFKQLTLTHFPKSLLARWGVVFNVDVAFNFSLFAAFMMMNAEKDVSLEDVAASWASNGLVMSLGQVFCADHITKKLVGQPVKALSARLAPGFFFFLSSAALKSPEIYAQIEKMAEIPAVVAQGGIQGGFALLVSALTVLALRSK